MTREECIRNHRDMWNWIADETLRRQTVVSKLDYILEHNITERLLNRCFCCQYTINDEPTKTVPDCSKCPLDWGSEADEFMCEDKEYKCDDDNLYALFRKAVYPLIKKDFNLIASLARQIANLPVKEVLLE